MERYNRSNSFKKNIQRVKPLSRGDKRTSSEPLDMLFDDRNLERTALKQTKQPTTPGMVCRKEGGRRVLYYRQELLNGIAGCLC